mmetsp:Transcript_18866/g.52449  ORF Transcript_18866/g.52449 Transcript_18866/m.52449 type:complete len:80 (-) Transcript_18866:71-310(-)
MPSAQQRAPRLLRLLATGEGSPIDKEEPPEEADDDVDAEEGGEDAGDSDRGSGSFALTSGLVPRRLVVSPWAGIFFVGS